MSFEKRKALFLMSLKLQSLSNDCPFENCISLIKNLRQPMQLLTTTALFMNNHEVSYELFFNPKAYRYLFCPTTFTDAWYLLPTFWLIKHGKEWIIRGVECEELKVQAINLVTRFLPKKYQI